MAVAGIARRVSSSWRKCKRCLCGARSNKRAGAERAEEHERRSSGSERFDVLEFLKRNGVSTDRFERSVDDLQLEVDRGEAEYGLDKRNIPLRNIQVARLLIRSVETGLYLIEEHQRFSDGLTRSRNIAPSEKLLHGESLESCCRRAIAEELASSEAASGAALDTDKAQIATKIQQSRSYVF